MSTVLYDVPGPRATRLDRLLGIISTAVMQLFLSRDDRKNWARAIAMMRRGFGGHPYGPNEDIARARRTERVGDYERPDFGHSPGDM